MLKYVLRRQFHHQPYVALKTLHSSKHFLASIDPSTGWLQNHGTNIYELSLNTNEISRITDLPGIHTCNSVDGSEIRRSPVEVASLSHYLQGLAPSQVVQNFFHQQYESL